MEIMKELLSKLDLAFINIRTNIAVRITEILTILLVQETT